MRSRMLVSLIMVTTAMVMLSLMPWAQPQAESGAPGNLIYINDNISTGAGIKILRRDDAGNLTELANSPVLTGGLGIFDIIGFNRSPTGVFAAVDIGPFEHDNHMIFNADRSRLFVCNQGSNDLSVFNVSADGLTLTPVPGSPFKTGPVPSSVALAAFDTVIVVNKNDPPGNPKPAGAQASIQTFKMAANGFLSPVPNSEIKLPTARCGEGVTCAQTSTPSQVIVAPGGRLAFVNDFFAGMIRPYKVMPDGTLKPGPAFDIRDLGEEHIPIHGKTFPFSLGLAIHPTENILYTGLLFEDRVAAFRFNPRNGKLTFLSTTPNGGSTVCWFVIRKDGRYMWATNQASNSVSTYDLADPTNPKEIQVIKFDSCGEPAQVAVDPTEQWIYFVNSAVTNKCDQRDPDDTSNNVHVLRIAPNGLLTEVNTHIMRLPVGERIQGIVTK